VPELPGVMNVEVVGTLLARTRRRDAGVHARRQPGADSARQTTQTAW
jgi:hypothetical protein